MKGEEGVWGRLPQEANGMKKSNEMEASPFRLIRFCFLLRPVYFLLSVIFLSQIKKRAFKKQQQKNKTKKTNQIIKWSGRKRTYNLCIVKKEKLEISGSQDRKYVKEGIWGHTISESKLPKGLSAMELYVKKT